MLKIVLICLFQLFIFSAHGQKISCKLKFEQGQTLEVGVEIKTTIAQQAMGQAIDFNIVAQALRAFSVTNVTEDNFTLRHKLNKVSFTFDGMGQKREFDSEKEKDINGQFGKSIRELLEKKYDVLIDTLGTTVMAIPDKIILSEMDSRMAIIASLLKGITDLVYPPQKGKASFFRIIPGSELSTGDSWTTQHNENGNSEEAAFTVTGYTDSTVLIDFIEKSKTVTRANMMGNEATTTLNNKTTGKIIIDRPTGILLKKTSVTESSGTTESSFGSLPVTSTSSSVITVQAKK